MLESVVPVANESFGHSAGLCDYADTAAVLKKQVVYVQIHQNRLNYARVTED